MRKAVLVTGGAGYIGANTCKALYARGFLPVTVDNLVLGAKSFVKWGPLVECDVRNSNAVAAVMREFSITDVMHFAAFAYVGESVTDPAKYYDNNIAGTLGILEAMRMAGASNLVFSSTCSVYGEPQALPVDEMTATLPLNPYGRTKHLSECMIVDFCRAYKLNAVRLRYFNAAGADADGELGEDRRVETHLIPRALMHLLGYIQDFAVLGGDYDTPDGTAVRDYIHVSDLADGHLLALELLWANGSGVFNLGSGVGYSVKMVLDVIERVTGRRIAIEPVARRPGDPAVLIADVSLAGRELGFKAARSSIDQIVETAWRWHQKTHPPRLGKIVATIS